MVLCAPCLLPLISSAGAAGSGGFAALLKRRKIKIALFLLMLILLLLAVLTQHLSKKCDTCQLQPGNTPENKP